MSRNYDSPLIYVSDLIFILSKLDYFGFYPIMNHGCRSTPVG
jgi:hypothetical protein